MILIRVEFDRMTSSGPVTHDLNCVWELDHKFALPKCDSNYVSFV
jgi:hypothetical protein